jgi:homoserine kinase type II
MAVYTKVSDPEAEDFVRAYDIGAFKGLTGIKQGVENSNYILEAGTGRYILTLYEKRVKRADLPFFLGLMEHLAAAGVPCPKPVRTRDDDVTRELAGRAAAVTGFLPGSMTQRITPEQCAELGRALAKMHVAAAGFGLHRPNALSLTGWEKLANDCVPTADTVRKGLADVLEDELSYLRAAWPDNLPRGVIHADLFPDNVFFNGNTLCGVIDFYFACEDLFAYDLAICINAWCFERDMTFNITKARSLLKGYEKHRPLSPAERSALPILARGSALRFLLTRLYDWLNQVPGALVKTKDPIEYLVRLEFHQRVTSAASYGIDQ